MTPIAIALLLTLNATGGAWPSGLNGYFGANLEHPGIQEATMAMAAHLNRQTLANTPPEEAWASFDAAREALKDRLTKAEGEELKSAAALFRNLTDYVALEGLFTQGDTRKALKGMLSLVKAQAQLDPAFDEARRDKISAIIEQKGTPVPSSILFGAYLLPYRRVRLPEGCCALEIQATPEFVDKEHEAWATFDFLDSPGPICRVDFETVDATGARIEKSDDGQAFTVAGTWEAKASGGLRPPLLPEKLFRARQMRVVVLSQADTAVLRTPRVFALKEAARAVCQRAREAPVLDGSFKEAGWPIDAPIYGLVNTETRAFAEAQTNARLCCTSDTLFIAVYAREPRMETLVANEKRRDAPLWEEESVEIVIQPAAGRLFRFVVNPLGAQFDAKNGEAAWNGLWEVATHTYPSGWAAEMAIPFEVLENTPADPEWKLQVIRTRRNVKNEHSEWAYLGASAKAPAGKAIQRMGAITFQ